nr:hypothetical protein [Tanacetum cinerariifolium]
MQTQTSNTLHNAIMEAGGKDRPPMLAPGSPVTTTETYMETYKTVSQDIRNQLNVEAEAVQIILTGIDNDIYSTVYACSNACEMWKAIERLKQGESINVQDLESNLYWEFGKFTSHDGESLESYYSRLVTLVKQSQELKTVSYHKLYDILKQHQNEVNEIKAKRIAHTANPLALVAQQQPVYHPQNHPTHYTQNSSTRSQQAATRNRGKAIVNSPQPIYDQEPSMVAKDDETSKDKKIDKLIALISLSFKKIYKPTNNNLRTSSNTSRANQDNSPRINKSTGYKDQRIGNVVGARETVGSIVVQRSGIQCYNCKEFRHVVREYWRDGTDDESEDQELEAHYMYIAQLQEVSPDAADSGPIFDSERVQKNDDDNDLAHEHELLASLIKKLKCEIDDTKNRNKFLETSNKVLVEKLKDEIEDFKNKNISLESSNNHFKEAKNQLSENNELLYNDFKKSQAELQRRNDVEYASKVEIDCAKAKGDLISYKMESQKSFNKYTQTIIDFNQTISKIKKKLSAHQETISIPSQQKVAQIKLYKTREDKELDKVIALGNKVKVLDNIVYKTGQSVQTMNMLNNKCRTSFARVNPRLYDIGCYNDNLALMLAPETDEVIRLEKESRSKLSDLIRAFDYEKLNNLYDLFVPQREKSSKQRYFSKRSRLSHTHVNNGNSKESFNKQSTLLEKRMDESILEYYYADHMNAILGVYNELDEVTNLQCGYLELLEKCECLEKVLSKSQMMSKSFEALQKHAIILEIDLQQCQEKIKNDKSFKENQSKEFRKEREQYFKFQYLKAQLQDKGIVIRAIPTNSFSKPQLKSNPIEDRVMLNNKKGKKHEVEDQRRNVKFSKNKTYVTTCNDSLNAKTLNVNFVCARCGKCVLNEKHDMYVLKYVNGVNSRTKMPIVVLKIYKPTNNNLQTSSNTSRANQDNSPRINRGAGYEYQRIGNVARARETVGSIVVQKSRIQCYNCKEFGHVARECQKLKRAKDATYRREKMLLYAADSGPIFDAEPLQKVSNDNYYNVFAIEIEHPEQSESVHDTHPIEQDAHNEIIDSLDMKLQTKLSAHQDTIFILTQQKEDQIKLYKTREDKEIKKVIELENKVKVLDNIVYKTGQSVQTMNMLNNKCRTIFVKPEHLKKAKQANPRLYAIGCYNDNLALMLTPESDEVIRLEKESRSKLSDLIKPFDYNKLNNLYDLFVPQQLLEKCKGLETELSKSKMMSKHFESVQKHVINLDLELQQCKEKINNDMSFKVNMSKDFCKEREQYFEIQDLKAQLQDKSIAIKREQYFEIQDLKAQLQDKSIAIRVIPPTSVSRPQLKSNPMEDRVLRNNSYGKKQELEDHRRNVKLPKNKTSVTACNDSLNAKNLNIKSVSMCDKCVLHDKHNMFVLKSVAKPIKRTVASKSNKKPRNFTRKIYEHVSKTCSWWYPKSTPSGYIWKPKSRIENVNPNLVEIFLFIVDSGCSNHMTGNLKLLINFVEKFLGTVKFGNDQIAPILGYGDLGNDLLTGSRGTDLYSITLQNTNSPNPICLVANVTSSQAWLWHRRLSHLNFDTINLLSKNDIVVGLPKVTFIKDHLCSSCELGKAKRKSFHTKLTPSS